MIGPVPAPVRAAAGAAGARAWLDRLPRLVADLERDWAITTGAPYPDATEALVLRAECADRTEAVLKLCLPRPGNQAGREITTLALVGARGCARLLRADPERGALLTERLGPSLHDLGRYDAPARQEILCDLARQVWRAAPDRGLPTGADRARSFARHIPRLWEQTGRPCSALAVAHALACAARREAAHDDAAAVLVHGDVHQWNALARGDGFALVDPDGLVAEPGCDLGVLMREDPVELRAGDPRDRARWLATRCGLDPGPIWEWGVADRVTTGLLLTRLGLQPVAAEMLATADWIAARE